MKHETLFIEGISRLKRHFLFKSFNRILFTASVGFFCIYTFFAVMGKMGFNPPLKYSPFYTIAAGLCLAFSLIYEILRRERFSNLLIDIDGRLNLKDRLSTAYEYHQSQIRSEFSDLLITDAGKRLALLKKKEIFPARLSVIHFLLGILFLINILIAFIGHTPHGAKQNRMDPAILNQMDMMLKNYTADQKIDNGEPVRAGTDTMEKMKADIAGMLKDPATNQDKLHSTLDRMLKEIQSEKMLLAKELAERLDGENIDNVLVEKIPQMTNLSLYHLKQLKKVIDRLFDNRIPDAIAGDISVLDKHQSLEKFIEQLIDHLDKLESDPLDEADAHSADSDTSSPSKGALTQSGGYSLKKEGDRSQPGRSKAGHDAYDSAAPDQEENPGDVLADEENDEAGAGSSSAGRGKAKSRLESPYEFEKATGSVIQDKTFSSQKQEYSVLIRSLTAIGETKVKKEDIVRPYRRELENILEKEDIPLNYRQYIKNYFLSIGLKAGLRKESEKQ